ncbi:hypothetical protein HSRCO_0844 [Halanaeroarchaeum sp. HSR-CO]|nr:hypothetical protein HSRCO_0844 [Halanaeroarchaeum sp. HSR-CO]
MTVVPIAGTKGCCFESGDPGRVTRTQGYSGQRGVGTEAGTDGLADTLESVSKRTNDG